MPAVMLVAGHQPNYLPYLGFFHKAAQVDHFVIADTTQFVKRGPFGWIHRNRILAPNGEQWLSVPILTKGRFTQRICDAEIDNHEPWRRKHWRAIEVAYRSTPHFGLYAPALRALYEREWTRLAPLAIELIRLILDWLDIRPAFTVASEAGIEAPSTDLIVAICRHAGSTTYLSGVHGRDYLDEARLKEAGVTVQYQEFTHPVYPQGDGPFVPNLCALDLLFRCGPESRKVLLG